MTCLEKLKIDHPKWDNKEVGAVIEDSCPWHYGYMAPPENCNNSMGYPCLSCWMRDLLIFNYFTASSSVLRSVMPR